MGQIRRMDLRICWVETANGNEGDLVILLRPARRVLGDGFLFARYIDQAAEGFYGFLLGQNSESITASAFMEPGHALSYENVMFAECDGVVAGMSLAYTGIQHRGFSDEPLKRAAGSSLRRMKLVQLLLAPLWRILDSVEEDEFYLHGVAVEPEFRGAGVGSLLMDDVESRGLATDSARLSLDVSAKNHGARKLYRRRGMAETFEWPNPRFLPTLFVRMTKDL